MNDWKQSVSLKKQKRTAGWNVPETFYRELLQLAIEMKYNQGWAAHVYKDKVGDWPPKSENGAPLAPSEYTKWFVESLPHRKR